MEDNLENLRYDKVILATDADVDGLHIRNLLITYFFKFFEQLVHDGHLYVLETPLFRTRNKDQTLYCYSEAERDAAAGKLGKNQWPIGELLSAFRFSTSVTGRIKTSHLWADQNRPV